jgi:hypothetical protein
MTRPPPSLLIASLLLAACTTTMPARRAAMVPALAPELSGATPLAYEGELSIGHSGRGGLGSPRLAGSGTDDGLEVIEPQYSAVLHLQDHAGHSGGIVYQFASGGDSERLARDQPDVHGDVHGLGVTGAVARWLGDGDWTAKITGDLIVYRLPYAKDTSCLADCAEDPPTLFAYEPAMSVSGLVGRRLGRVTLFGGMKLAHHPTIERGGRAAYWADKDNDLELGPLNLVASMGAEVKLGRVRLLGVIYAPLREDPVAYPAAFALSLNVGLGKALPERWGTPPK